MKTQDYLLASGARCHLTKARHPLLKNYFVLSFPYGEPSVLEEPELLARALKCARELSLTIAGKQEAFTVIYSGHATRRAQGWHAHIIVLANRRQKAWLYFVLSGKNLLQAMGFRRDGEIKTVAQPDRVD